jgi:IS4 transposase
MLFSMYAYHKELDRKYCMQARVDRDKLPRSFVESGQKEAIVNYLPTPGGRRQCDETEVLITNLIDKKCYPAQEFKRLYHLRWGVEEFYKRLKHHQEI